MSDEPQPTIDPSRTVLDQPQFLQPPTPSRSRPASRGELRFATKALVRSRGRVLLVKERRADGSTFWTLPGGGIEPGETPRESLGRELREEIACECSLGAIVARCRYEHTSRPDTTSLYAVFEATLDGHPTPNATEGVVDCRWVDPARPPSGTLAPFERLCAEIHR